MQESLSSSKLRLIFKYRTKLQEILSGLDIKVKKERFFKSLNFL